MSFKLKNVVIFLKIKNNLAAALTAMCMVVVKWLIAELYVRVSVEIVNKTAKFSFQIVVMSLWDNIKYMFYSAIL